MNMLSNILRYWRLLRLMPRVKRNYNEQIELVSGVKDKWTSGVRFAILYHTRLTECAIENFNVKNG